MRLLILFAAAILLLGCTAVPQSPPAQPPVPTGTEASPDTPAADASSSGPSAPPVETYPPAEQPPAETAPTQPSTSLEHSEFTYNSGIWKIHGTLYESEQAVPKKAVVLVPMLGETRYSYPISFIEKLHDALPDAVILAIDPRGHGESDNQGSWSSFDMEGFRDMKTDILNIKKNLVSSYPAVSEFNVVGASIGSTSAINAAAQDKAITRVVMLSPGMEYRGVDITRSMEDYVHPLLVVASSGDSYSVQAMNEIESLVSTPQFEQKTYPGSAHGTDMFAATAGTSESLENVITEFLR